MDAERPPQRTMKRISNKKTGNAQGVSGFISERKKLFLSVLVSLIEHINSSSGVDNLGLAGVEWVRCVGNLDLNERVGNTFDLKSLLGVHAGACDEHYLV